MAEVSGIGKALIEEGTFEPETGWALPYRLRRSKEAREVWVFLNGLGDDYSVWNSLISNLQNVTTLQVDLRGQGRSLLRRLSVHPDSDFRLKPESQCQDLAKLLEYLGIQNQVGLAGFSYGGGIALKFASIFPEVVSKTALIVPFVIRLDKAFPMQRIWNQQWNFAKSWGLVPSHLADSVEKHYERFLTHYMNHRYENRLVDPVHRHAAIELSHGIMEFDAFRILEKLPEKGVFLLTADLDTLVPSSLYKEFWERVPERCRGHWIRVPDGEHLLLEQKPDLVKSWLEQLINR